MTLANVHERIAFEFESIEFVMRIVAEQHSRDYVALRQKV
jgi:hypothetical protein